MKQLPERLRDLLRRNLDTRRVSELCVLALEAAEQLEQVERLAVYFES